MSDDSQRFSRRAVLRGTGMVLAMPLLEQTAVDERVGRHGGRQRHPPGR